jgi:hypothetical protein
MYIIKNMNVITWNNELKFQKLHEHYKHYKEKINM